MTMTFMSRCLCVAAMAMVLVSRPARADIADDARALVERAVQHIQTTPPDKAFEDIARPGGEFWNGELYVFCMTSNGTVLVNAGNTKLKGKVMWDLHDTDGRPVIAEMIGLAMAKERGWIEYVWPNPGTGRLQRKVTYVVKVDEKSMCGSGYYKPGAP